MGRHSEERGEKEAYESGVVVLRNDVANPDAVVVHGLHHTPGHGREARARALAQLGTHAKVGWKALVGVAALNLIPVGGIVVAGRPRKHGGADGKRSHVKRRHQRG